jgi:hypothetical protein
MEPNAMTYLSRTLTFATAGALTLTLAACDPKPAADNPGKIFAASSKTPAATWNRRRPPPPRPERE